MALSVPIDALVTVCCRCGERLKVRVVNAVASLRARGAFGYGRHVTDPRAFAMRFAVIRGWGHDVDAPPLGKSTVTLRCPDCRDADAARAELDDAELARAHVFDGG